MKQWLSVLSVSVCCVLPVEAATNSAASAIGVKPTRLMLAQHDDAVCDSFLAVMQQRFDSNQPLEDHQQLGKSVEDQLEVPAHQMQRPALNFQQDLSDPSWQWLTWTPWPQRPATYNGSLGYTDNNTLLTADNAPSAIQDQLMLRIYMLGWRGPFAEYFLVPSAQQAGLQAPALVDEALDDFLKPLALPRGRDSAQSFRNAYNLFKFQDQLYYLNPQPSERFPTVWQAWPKPRQVCAIAKPQLPEIAQVRALHRVVMDTYVTLGENEQHGTLGFHPPIGDGVWFDLLARPWTVKPLQTQCADSHCIKASATAKWLQHFGHTDAWSQREARALGDLLTLTARPVAAFYQQHLLMEAEQANRLATDAVQNYLYQASGSRPAPDVESAASCGVDGSDQGVTGPCAWQADYPLDQLSTLPEAPKTQLLANRNWYGKTALMWAAHFDDYDAIEQLLQLNAPLNAVTKVENDWQSLQQDQRSALMYAAENASPATIALLLKAGADPSANDSAGHDLMFYAKKNRSLQLAGFTGNSLAPLQTSDVPAPSFACEGVKRAHEQLLCASKGLRIYDQALSLRYQALQKTALAATLKDQQRQWLKNLWADCKLAEQSAALACYKQQYRVRIRLLDMLLEQLQPLKTDSSADIAY